MTEINGQTVLITGASRGIGAAAAREFAAAGANVVLMARSAGAIEDIAAEIGGLAVTGDVATYGDMDHAVAAAVDRFGGLDILINNAGVIEPVASVLDADPDGWATAIDINLKGVFNGIRAALPGMVATGAGTIITISSGAAHSPLEGWSHYCSSKAGAAMLTRCTDLECRDKGIRVMGLSPGTVATQMQREIKASGVNPVSNLNWEDHVPPEWPAKCLLWMCGPAGDGLRGQEVSLRDEDVRKQVGLT
ncbi:Glucose 1-dehydrogenase [Thalassovita gelatinovora]|uniref:Glucose 1-dehydrogenase n=1 Tax=Thalassovita gelatinovora TaxID=53501 RepID=A0A0N7LUG3_THAGE|nr:SDR family oxidoreductase [Thalassovita gelatinovora]QIZ80920.1 SDR family oxidoreductase [Thalassovita gelatinovora]CUH63418.1 Glucose 1-dehydrogenase [Thalassovita gelatinovora]SEQ66688.1 NADP-dependent 3-hydroxy acid dehydrogenase YdfG [Thalassovita gelatinovora]